MRARRILIPYRPNEHFVGREPLLWEIHEALHRAPVATLTQSGPQAVVGQGGVGKTTLAREYAHRFWRLYDDILWVTATDETAIVSRPLVRGSRRGHDEGHPPGEFPLRR